MMSYTVHAPSGARLPSHLLDATSRLPDVTSVLSPASAASATPPPLPRVVPMDPFKTERRVFADALASLLKSHSGQYAVVYKTKLVGICPSLESAVELGWTSTNSRAFFVRRIERQVGPVVLPSRVA